MSQYIYFIQCGEGGPIKIGVTQDPAARMRKLQTACPYPLTMLCAYRIRTPNVIGRRVEANLHAKYLSVRLTGEWFLPTDTLLEEAREWAEREATTP